MEPLIVLFVLQEGGPRGPGGLISINLLFFFYMMMVGGDTTVENKVLRFFSLCGSVCCSQKHKRVTRNTGGV